MNGQYTFNDNGAIECGPTELHEHPIEEQLSLADLLRDITRARDWYGVTDDEVLPDITTDLPLHLSDDRP